MSEDKQSIIDREILYADRAGIDYWNFGWYEPRLDNPDSDSLFGFTNPLKLYLSSPYKNKIKFTLTFMNNNMGVVANWRDKTVPLFLKYVEEANYQTVLNGRPLVFVLTPSYLNTFFGNSTQA